MQATLAGGPIGCPTKPKKKAADDSGVDVDAAVGSIAAHKSGLHIAAHPGMGPKIAGPGT
eukprot:gene6525-2083_t